MGERTLENLMHCAVDTNFLIYFFDSHSPLHKKSVNMLHSAAAGKLKISGSELLFAEMLAYPALNDRAASGIRNKLGLLPLSYHPVSLDILTRAGALRRHHSSLRLPDAIHLATAIAAKADCFVTNDQRIISLKKINGTLISALE